MIAFLLLLAVPLRAYDGPAWTLLHASPGDFEGAQAVSLSTRPPEEGLWGLAPLASSGTLTSPPIQALFPFDELVLSWNAATPEGAALSFEAQVRLDGAWSGWYKMGRWSPGASASVPGQRDADGEVRADTLVLDRPAQALRYRVSFAGKAGAGPVLKLVAAAYDKRDAFLPSRKPFSPGPWVRELALPERSQRSEPDDLRHDVCSPVSLSMAAAALGLDRPASAWIPEVRDHAGEGLYGNWPFNAAAAGERGLAAYVARLPSLEGLQREIAEGRPAVASLTFQEGELSGAPMRATHGHLVAVRGFTPGGDVIVNDPAGKPGEVRRVYQRAEFERAWLINKRGLIYRLSRPLAAPLP